MECGLLVSENMTDLGVTVSLPPNTSVGSAMLGCWEHRLYSTELSGQTEQENHHLTAQKLTHKLFKCFPYQFINSMKYYFVPDRVSLKRTEEI